jgi:hypothetical protein
MRWLASKAYSASVIVPGLNKASISMDLSILCCGETKQQNLSGSRWLRHDLPGFRKSEAMKMGLAARG